jgi:enterobacteria phage integrase
VTPRRRSKAKRGWPANLYERDGYYSWRNPVTREEFGIGRSRTEAFAQAVEANLHVAKLTDKPRLIHKLTGEATRSVQAWAEKYAGMQAKQEYSDATRKHYRSLSKRMVQMLKPETPLKSITALTVSGVLETVAVTEGKARLAQALRNFMRDSFREAIVQGWRDDNPVRDTKLSVAVEVKRSRLSFEVFTQAYGACQLDWLRNAMALALVSAQRREDIALAQFPAFHDGGWWCVQESEKATNPHRIFIPLELRLDCFGMSLDDVVKQCRRTGVVSKYLVHQTVKRGNSPVGRRIWLDTISHRFAELIEGLGIDWGEKTPPTFHEIRSLSERLYAAQGGINTQELLGHNEPATTALYHDSRGSEWVRVKVPV